MTVVSELANTYQTPTGRLNQNSPRLHAISYVYAYYRWPGNKQLIERLGNVGPTICDQEQLSKNDINSPII